MPVGLLDGSDVRTIEGRVGPTEPLDAVQQAFKDTDAVQCGMCFPGMATAPGALLRRVPDPSAAVGSSPTRPTRLNPAGGTSARSLKSSGVAPG
ncbi:2Fe-2S iron-sulfur cluster-binding protein [Streptomyces sp. NPDC000987]|uniref:2Fe-2S iron-sulfur cluster-binding protein n=1 Tax=Streptomyces sp. NPDC000987 TaxID=3154374 RepID=UPI00331725B2